MRTKKIATRKQTCKTDSQHINELREEREYEDRTHSIFRADLLKSSPAENRGSFLPDNGFGKDFLISKHLVLKEWYKILKKHPEFIPFDISKEDTIDMIILKMKEQTDRIFIGYNWELRLERKNYYTIPEICIIYWKNVFEGDLPGLHLPLDWLLKSKNKNIRIVSLELFRQITQHFNIESILNHFGLYEFDNWETKEDLHTLLESEMGYDPIEDAGIHNELFDEYWSYKKGEINEFAKRLNSNKCEDISEELLILKRKHKLYFEWFNQGFDLMKQQPIKITDFIFNPERENEDDTGLSINETVFFPWSIEDHTYKGVEDHVNDTSNEIGLEPVNAYGFFSAKENKKPPNIDSLIALKKFIEEGQTLYFKYGHK